MYATRVVPMTGVFAIVAGSVLYANPIPVPGLEMPEEYISATISEQPDGLGAAVDGRYLFVNVGGLIDVTMRYPVAPHATDIGAWIDIGLPPPVMPLDWRWSDQTYPTILPEPAWSALPMIEWDIAPVPPSFTILTHYEHALLDRPDEWVFLYPMGFGKDLPAVTPPDSPGTESGPTVAEMTVNLPGRYPPKGLRLDYDPTPFTLTGDAGGWQVTAVIASSAVEPMTRDFILTLFDRWADPLAWFSQPPDMADGIDIYSSVEENAIVADDFDVPVDTVVPPNVGAIQWWGSYPGWESDHPDPSTEPPRPDYFVIRIFDDTGVISPGSGLGAPGTLLYEETIVDAEQTYFGVVVHPDPGGVGAPRYEHKFQYTARLARPFQPLPARRYWLSIVGGPVPCERSWGWATSPLHQGASAMSGPLDGGPPWDWAPIPLPDAGPVDMAFVLASRRPKPLPAGRYCLTEGSVLTELDPSGATTPVVVPIRGTFLLEPTVLGPSDAHFAVRDLEFTSGGAAPTYVGQGEGTYDRAALGERMTLEAAINEIAGLLFDSGWVPPQAPFPWIEIDLPQVTDPATDPPGRFDLHLVAAPCPQVWFSTEVGFTPADPTGVGLAHVSDGDLVSAIGRVVRTNHALTSRLGIMPPSPDVGLDAVLGPMPALVSPVFPPPRCEIWFSSEMDVHSETLGPLQHGDLLSDAGRIVRTNGDLIAPFSPMPPVPDYGLDAIARGPDGVLLFSTEEDFVSESLGVLIRDGDLLAETGRVVRTNAELMANFQPLGPVAEDLGLDAVFVWPHGEIWFSIEGDFVDARWGPVHEGDLLSDVGRIVRRNRELMEPFSPLEDLADFGLDALQVVPPTLIHIADGLGAMKDPTAFISPKSKYVGFDSVDILVSEVVGLVAAHTASTGGAPPEVVSLTPLDHTGLHRVVFSGPIEVAEWTTVRLTVANALNIQADLCFQVGHLPDDCDGNGQVNLADATRFGQLFRAGEPLLQGDLDDNGEINLNDATKFGQIWNGTSDEGGGPDDDVPWLGKGLPPRPPCGCESTD